MTGKRIVLSEKVDPGVVGGVLLEMNGKRYDNTLRHRLEAIHARPDGGGVSHGLIY